MTSVCLIACMRDVKKRCDVRERERIAGPEKNVGRQTTIRIKFHHKWREMISVSSKTTSHSKVHYNLGENSKLHV